MNKKAAALSRNIQVENKIEKQAQGGIDKSIKLKARQARAEFYKKKYEGTELNKKKE